MVVQKLHLEFGDIYPKNYWYNMKVAPDLQLYVTKSLTSVTAVLLYTFLTRRAMYYTVKIRRVRVTAVAVEM
jgi:hypothetical protein